jgi:hypothetical protein
MGWACSIYGGDEFINLNLSYSIALSEAMHFHIYRVLCPVFPFQVARRPKRTSPPSPLPGEANLRIFWYRDCTGPDNKLGPEVRLCCKQR